MDDPRPRPVNALTIDVEDWVQSVVDPDLPLTDRFIRNTHRVLELLAEARVRATFFVLGLAAEKSPGLVRAIHDAGHEVQSHGYGHRLITGQTRETFREDVRRSKAVLEDILATAIRGYRAPAFSITRQTIWALEVLAECGYRYDSSIVPAWNRRYGIPGAPRGPHQLRLRSGAEMVEFPVATLALGPLVVPMGGGGYFRAFPLGFTRRAVSRLNATGHATAIYLHPYEFAANELGELRPSELGGRRISWTRRMGQGIGRTSVAERLRRMLAGFRFSTMQDGIDAASPLPCFDNAGPGEERCLVQDIPRGKPILR